MTDDSYYVTENLLALRNTRIGNLMGICALTLPTSQPSCGISADDASGHRPAVASAGPRGGTGAALATLRRVGKIGHPAGIQQKSHISALQPSQLAGFFWTCGKSLAILATRGANRPRT
jgi:hypothetical protein